MLKIKAITHANDCISKIDYVPEYPYPYIESIKQNIKHSPSIANIQRHESELALLEALKTGKARVL